MTTVTALMTAVYLGTDAISDRGWETADDSGPEISPLVSRSDAAGFGGSGGGAVGKPAEPAANARFKQQVRRNSARISKMSAGELEQALKKASGMTGRDLGTITPR